MRSLLLIFFVIATLPMAFVEPFIGLLLWVLFSDMNPYRFTYGLAATIHWVYPIALITIFSSLINSKKLQSLQWDSLTLLMLVFAVFTAVTTYFSVVPDYAWRHWDQLIKVLVLAFFIIPLVNSRQRMDWLIWTFVASFAFWGVKGGVFTLMHGGHYIVKGPTASFYRDRNQFALVMCMTLPLMRYLQLQTDSKWIGRGMWVGMGLMCFSILGTYSRGGQIALAIVLLALILKSRHRFRLLFLSAVFLPVALSFMPPKWVHRMDGLVSGSAEQGGSYQGRVQSWQFATNYAVHHPILGGGFGVWDSGLMWARYGPPDISHGRAIHSVWFEVLAEQGFLGLGIYVCMLAAAWFYLGKVRRLARGDPECLWLYDLAGFVQVSIIAFGVAGSALPQGYFNFLFQLYAVAVLLRRFALQEPVATRPAKPQAIKQDSPLIYERVRR